MPREMSRAIGSSQRLRIYEMLEPFREANALDVKFVHSVRWNVLAALMENAYIDCDHGAFFFHELLTVYQAGHLPCGWIGAWPEGKLVVY
jgi:hypothetical protein